MGEMIADILTAVVGSAEAPTGAYNIRVNGQTAQRASTEHIEIRPKADGSGIEIWVAPGTVGEEVHIPVAIDQAGIDEKVYNDFHIGADSVVTIISGCGIHNEGADRTRHAGVHSFFVGENARVRYVEKHYGQGNGSGERVLDPVTDVTLAKGSYLEMESVQIKGVDSTRRVTRARVAEDATFVSKEIILTEGTQSATTEFHVELDGERSAANVVSRSVAKGRSTQAFYSVINGNNACRGHSACDAIIMDQATVKAVPDVTARHVDAELIHEAAIGKIAGDQIIKLMTLGLTEEEAEAQIVDAFLR